MPGKKGNKPYRIKPAKKAPARKRTGVFGLAGAAFKGYPAPEIKVKFYRGHTVGKADNPAQAAEYLRSLFEPGKIELQEHFLVLYLDAKRAVIGYYRHSIGGHSQTVADIRIVFATALKVLARGIILCHNHPSGTARPSQGDREMTKQAVDAGELLEINVLDHVIITKNAYFSFKEEGILEQK